MQNILAYKNVPSCFSLSIKCVCVCVCVRERERGLGREEKSGSFWGQKKFVWFLSNLEKKEKGGETLRQFSAKKTETERLK